MTQRKYKKNEAKSGFVDLMNIKTAGKPKSIMLSELARQHQNVNPSLCSCIREQSHEGRELQMCSGVLHEGHRAGPEKRRVLLQQVVNHTSFTARGAMSWVSFLPVSVGLNMAHGVEPSPAGPQHTANWGTTQRRPVTAREPSGLTPPTAKPTDGWGE